MIYDSHAHAAYKVAICYVYGMNAVYINHSLAAAALTIARRQRDPPIMGVSSLSRMVSHPSTISTQLLSDYHTNEPGRGDTDGDLDTDPYFLYATSLAYIHSSNNYLHKPYRDRAAIMFHQMIKRNPTSEVRAMIHLGTILRHRATSPGKDDALFPTPPPAFPSISSTQYLCFPSSRTCTGAFTGDTTDLGGINDDQCGARYYWRMAANLGNAEACRLLAESYENDDAFSKTHLITIYALQLVGALR